MSGSRLKKHAPTLDKLETDIRALPDSIITESERTECLENLNDIRNELGKNDCNFTQVSTDIKKLNKLYLSFGQRGLDKGTEEFARRLHTAVEQQENIAYLKEKKEGLGKEIDIFKRVGEKPKNRGCWAALFNCLPCFNKKEEPKEEQRSLLRKGVN